MIIKRAFMRKLRTHAASIDEQVLEGVLGLELFKSLKI
jgi:hypothetical protein